LQSCDGLPQPLVSDDTLSSDRSLKKLTNHSNEKKNREYAAKDIDLGWCGH
jgi:hypothetical protein